MEDSDAKVKQQLVAAAELFYAGKYTQCRKVLAQVKMAHPSIELNQMIAEYKQSPSKTAAIANKIMDTLTLLTPVLTPKPPRIAHQLHYWNLLVLMQLQGNFQVAELVTQEGLLFLDSLRTEVSLMLLYQKLNERERAGMMASALALIETLERVVRRTKELNEDQRKYRFLCQVLFNRVLLKLGIIQGSKIMFMMRFNQSPENKQEMEVTQINGIGTVVYQQLLHAEIEYHSGNLPQAIKILSELLTTVDTLGRNKDFVKCIIDQNMAIILNQFHKNNAAQLLLRKSLKYLTSAEELNNHNERSIMISKCKENIMLTGIMSGNVFYSALYEHMKSCGSTNSFKINYRKAELSIKYYHQLLSNPQRALPNKQVHDNYEPVYYYPNQPYFQQKGKNKNPSFSAGKAYYRRYVMPEWENNIIVDNQSIMVNNFKENEAEVKEKKKPNTVSKNGKTAKKEEQQKEQNNQLLQDPHKAKIAFALASAQAYLKQALIFLEKERNVVINLQGEEKSFTHQINQKLHSEYVEYKSSLLSLLCYVQMSQRQWTLALHSADSYIQFSKIHQLESRSPSHQQTYFAVLTHRMEAMCELGRMANAYEVMQDIATVVDYAQSALVQARSTASQQMGLSYLEQMSQYGNFCYNVAVLHSRDNKLPESFQAIQKVMQQLRVIPSSQQARLPLSAIQLLIHYNLRTGNSPSAIQLIKRRRILGIPTTLSHQAPTLSITK